MQILRLTQQWHQALGCEPLAAHDLQSLFQLKRELTLASDPHNALWNFHPQGTLAQMLRHLQATDTA